MKTDRIGLRVDEARKVMYEAKAKERGMTLAAWLTMVADQACDSYTVMDGPGRAATAAQTKAYMGKLVTKDNVKQKAKELAEAKTDKPRGSAMDRLGGRPPIAYGSLLKG